VSEHRPQDPEPERLAAVAAGGGDAEPSTQVRPLGDEAGGASVARAAAAGGEAPPPLPGPLANIPQAQVAREKPEILVGAAFAGAFLLGRVLRRILS